jgi:DNA-binding NarL/FixJ family response regulator
MPRRIEVIVIDPDAAYSALLKTILPNAAGMGKVSLYSNLKAAVDVSGGTFPGVVLADIKGCSDPSSFVKGVKTGFPEAAILIVSQCNDEDSIAACLQAGASGYLLKKAPLASICDAVEEAHAGGCPLCPQVARKVARWFHAHRTAPQAPPNLSRREEEILTMVANGAKNREIAAKLGLSEATVRAHLQRTYKKLNVTSRVQAVAGRRKRG